MCMLMWWTCYLLWTRCQSASLGGGKEMRTPWSLNRLNHRPSRRLGPSRAKNLKTWWVYPASSTIVLLLSNWMILACHVSSDTLHDVVCNRERPDKDKIMSVLAVTVHSLSMSGLFQGHCPLSDIHLPVARHERLGQSHCQSTRMEQHDAWGQSSIFISNFTSSSHYCRLVAYQTLKDKSHICFVTLFMKWYKWINLLHQIQSFRIHHILWLKVDTDPKHREHQTKKHNHKYQ